MRPARNIYPPAAFNYSKAWEDPYHRMWREPGELMFIQPIGYFLVAWFAAIAAASTLDPEKVTAVMRVIYLKAA